ncbi:MAG: N-acetylmuramoyl-L-alanine amidase, partial [Lachnospiraceae bacterium]|nr:N-acetylmuramoyl-L-alanine amidase [Lachnospiraceae bacterium]
ALQANASGASVFIRIHCNGSSNTSVHGSQTYSAAPGNAYLSAGLIQEGQRLGNIVRQKFVEATGFRDGGALAGNDMTGINWCTVPVTIVEMGFMTNEEECRKLVDPGFQKIMAIGIANGIDTYLSR